MTGPRIDPAEVEAILADLVRIPSPNPPGDEVRVVSHITRCWTPRASHGRPTSWPRAGRISTCTSAPGAPALALNGHSDTMPPGEGWTSDPWHPVVHDGVMTGLGACDMKAGLAAMLGVALALARAARHSHAGLRLDIVVDEEATGDGSKLARCPPTAAGAAVVIVEPTRLALVPVGNGQINIAYTVRGAAAHGSTPGLGRNAVAAASRAVVALEHWAETRRPPPTR